MSGYLLLITDTETEDAVVVDDLDDWLAAEKELVGDSLDLADDIFTEIAYGNWDLAASHLGYVIEKVHDTGMLTDPQWFTWIAHHLDQDRRWTDDRIFIEIDRQFTGQITAGEWPKGVAVQVCGVHADREQSWRKVTSWWELRNEADNAYRAEDEALAEIARQKREDYEKLDPLRCAVRTFRESEESLERSEKALADQIRDYTDQGMSVYKIAQITGLTQPRIARMLDRSENR